MLDLDLLDDNPFQPRGAMDEVKLAELASSIAQSGLLQPIAVRPSASGRFHIVAGHRRVAALKRLRDAAANETERAKYSTIRAQALLALDDAQMAVGAYVENVQRADLNAVEEAAALARIRDLTGLNSPKEVAARTGQNDQRVRRLFRLHASPAVVKTACTTGLLVAVGTDDAAGALPDSKGRKETRRLDLLAALEFLRLYEHIFRTKPRQAEERTGAAIRHALTEGWGVRRIHDYVEGVISGRVKPESPAAEAAEPGGPALFEVTSSRWVIHLSRLAGASPAQLAGLRAEFERLFAELSTSAALPVSTATGT